MRVAFVNQPWIYARPPHPAGSLEIWTYEVARRLASRCDVTVYGGGSRFGSETFEDEGVRYRFFPTAPDALLRRVLERLPLGRHPRRPLVAAGEYYVLYLLGVVAALRRRPVDVVHIQNQFPFARLIRRLVPGVRVVLHMHSEWLSQLDPALTVPAVAASDRVLGCSEHVAARVREAHPRFAARCRAVHNGVDLAAFAPASAHNSRARYDSAHDDGERVRFAYVGRISPEKGVHVLLEAFVRAARCHPGLELTVAGPLAVLPAQSLVRLSEDPRVRALERFYAAGSDDYLAYLRGLLPADLAARVRFTGQLARDQVQAVYREADVLVNPALSESFGMSLVEAMAAGLPVIATRAGGQPEIVEHGRSGLLVEPADTAALSEAMLALAADPHRRAEFGTRGRERAVAHFSWERVADQVFTIYEDVCRTPQPASLSARA